MLMMNIKNQIALNATELTVEKSHFHRRIEM